MTKLILLPFLLLTACLLAGTYGALHNQISYTVSPEYFRAFKFPQFNVPATWPARLCAAYVGWQASWWMGFLIGVPVLFVGLLLPGWRLYLSRCLIAFTVVTGTTLIVGLAALVYAEWTITETSLDGYWFPPGVVDKVAFARAGTMHDHSYLGGCMGIVTGSIYLVVEYLRQTAKAKMRNGTHHGQKRTG